MGESTYFSLPPPPTTGLQLSGCCHLVETTTRSATVAAGSCGSTRSFLAIRSRPTKGLQRALTASGRKLANGARVAADDRPRGPYRPRRAADVTDLSPRASDF